jgi:primosomal protein N' (replication factor Y)
MSGKTYYINVLLAYSLSKEFTYKVNSDHKPSVGTVVSVPFRSKQYAGIVMGISDVPKISDKKIREISEISAFTKLNSRMIKFMNWVADYNLIDRGYILKMILAQEKVYFSKRDTKNNTDKKYFKKKSISLNLEQEESSKKIIKLIKKNEYITLLLDGLPGSGKTEVYFKVLQNEFFLDSQILILFPEVSLSNEFVRRIEDRFGFSPEIWHSKITASQKKKILKRIVSGEAKIIVGARSALFLPYSKLGMIIIDEEHDSSYKQEEKGIYHARDMAVVKASIEKIPLLLVSATPSLETTYNVLTKKYSKVSLKNKFSSTPMPKIHIIDMKKEKLTKDRWISNVLAKNIEIALKNKKQTLLFINKRGYAPVVICKSCGHKITCKNCSSYLVEHLKSKSLLCHHCGFKLNSFSLSCPSCENDDKEFLDYGVGVEKVYTEVSRIFPSTRICLFSSDHINSQEEMSEKIKQIIDYKFDIIIGTQIITKGYHFPKLTCVGIIDADMTLRGGDLRASEKTYQILYQVAGRAGRSDSIGKVFLQTYFPNNETILSLAKMERDKFYLNEINSRNESFLPPIGKMAALIVSGNNNEEVRKQCLILSNRIPSIKDLEIYGPAPAPLSRLKGKFRQRFLVHDKKARNMQKIVSAWLSNSKTKLNVNISVDIDPYTFA